MALTGPVGLFLKKALRVDVDRNANPAARLRCGGQHGAQKPLQVDRARRLGREPETMAFAQDRDRRLGRTEQDDLVVAGVAPKRRDAPGFGPRQVMGGARQHARVGFRRAAILGGNDDRREAPEWRQAAAAPLIGLFTVEPLGVA
jgi:hypothetical protein